MEGSSHSFDRRMDMQANELEAQEYQNDYVAGQLANLSVDVATLQKDFRHLLTEHLLPIQSHRSPCQCTGVIPSPINSSKHFPSHSDTVYPIIKGLSRLSTIRPENSTSKSNSPPLQVKPPSSFKRDYVSLCSSPSSLSSAPPLETPTDDVPPSLRNEENPGFPFFIALCNYTSRVVRVARGVQPHRSPSLGFPLLPRPTLRTLSPSQLLYLSPVYNSGLQHLL